MSTCFHLSVPDRSSQYLAGVWGEMCAAALFQPYFLLSQVCLHASWQSFLIPALFYRAVIGNVAMLQADCLLPVLA